MKHNNEIIKPLSIGKLNFKTNLIQAPLAGISFSPFRQLLWQHGDLAYACTEMISAKTLLYQQNHRTFYRFTTKHPIEKTVCYQLSGNNARELALAAKLSQALGADIIDLNCGCPQPKILKKQAGASHLNDLKRLANIIKAMRAQISCPLTVKVRLLAKNQQDKNRLLAKMIEDQGADALIVHGRRVNERYDTMCDLNSIADMCAEINIPVIVNGDIACYESLKRSLHLTGAQGVMIGRASIGKPWLFKMLRAENEENIAWSPTLTDIKSALIEHIKGLVEFKGEAQAVLLSRRLVPYYFKDVPEARTLIDATKCTTTLFDQVNLIENFSTEQV